MRKILKTVSIACALMITIGFGKVTPVDAAAITATATSNVNMRTGCSTKYKSIGKIKKGTKVKIKKIAPMGDPVSIELRGYEICVSKKDLAKIIVEM